MNAAALALADADWRSWGGVERPQQRLAAPAFRSEAAAALEAARRAGRTALPVGLGRSYGDSGLNPDGVLVDMRRLDRFIAFDAVAGTLTAEAGVSLAAVIDLVAPRGFFLPTTPGTRFVTLGGAVANDVHGKNHHSAGAFGAAVRRLTVLRSDRGVVETGPDLEPELFRATIGGLGLTGIILAVAFDLARTPSSEIEAEIIPFCGLDEFLAIAAESEGAFEHTVAWIDCLSRGKDAARGLFTRGVWAPDGARSPARAKRGLAAPFDAPSFLLDRRAVAAFNALYYARGKATAGRARLPLDRFFYPLDGVGRWNRLYGRRGFYQYQSVVPPAAMRDATAEMLDAIRAAGEGSFLAVLKTFGTKPSPGLLSFPTPGATLALDFPNRGASTLALLARLDAIVAAAGGRLYPAKDGRMPRAMFDKGYPARERFAAQIDPALASAFWKRMNA